MNNGTRLVARTLEFKDSPRASTKSAADASSKVVLVNVHKVRSNEQTELCWIADHEHNCAALFSLPTIATNSPLMTIEKPAMINDL